MYLPEEIQNKIMLYLSTPSADCIRHLNRSTPSADCIRHLVEHLHTHEPLDDILESHMMREVPEYEDYDAEVLVKLWDIPRHLISIAFHNIRLTWYVPEPIDLSDTYMIPRRRVRRRN